MIQGPGAGPSGPEGAHPLPLIAKSGEPYLRLEPYRERKTRRKLGVLKGQIRIASDFDETPPDVIHSFYDSNLFPGEGRK